MDIKRNTKFRNEIMRIENVYRKKYGTGINIIVMNVDRSYFFIISKYKIAQEDLNKIAQKDSVVITKTVKGQDIFSALSEMCEKEVFGKFKKSSSELDLFEFDPEKMEW
jgi:hypothetical protein